MDGNGRWAESRGLPRVEGHRVGVRVVKDIIRCCMEQRIATLSLFAFSRENWSRPEMEVEFLMQLFVEALGNELNELHEHAIRLRFIGDRERLSAALCEKMQFAETLTASNDRLILSIAINYGGTWDIMQAARKLSKEVLDGKVKVEAINEKIFSTFLSTTDLTEPDLFIRTSGEQRISNFFLWQLAFTELYFTEVHWPDFNAKEFEKALYCFSQRERRYGQISEQRHA